jgi:U3 small nucleolar RNA-associated protein 22
VLARHVSAGVAGDIHFLTPVLYPRIAPPPEVRATYIKGDGDAFQALLDGFEVFVRHLKDVKDLPLGISSVVPVGEGLTYTSVYPPHAQNYGALGAQQPGSYYIPIHDVILQLEGSGKWPDDLRAIQKIKIGLLLRIATQLEATHPVTARVGLENADVDIANAGFLDVVYEHGYSFRVRIQQDPNHREIHLIERSLKNKSLTHADRTKFETALKRYEDTFVRGVTHAQALTALRGKYYFLPATIRLVKRWIAAHMLSPQIPERVVELLVCFVFLRPHPWVAPASAEVGFLRTLQVLSTWDWRKEPLIVDFDGSCRYDEISKTFEGMRKQDLGIAHTAWCIPTSYDSSGACWTKDRPGKAVAARVTALAKSSLDVLSKDAGSVKVHPWRS